MKLREKTLIVFTGDNGSVPVGTINGRRVDGHKSQVNEGGSRVPLIANCSGFVPAGKVCTDLVDFSDFYATFADLAGAKLPEGVTFDSRSFAPQLRGEKGTPREWVYVHLGANRYVRDARWKLTGDGKLFDMTGAPFVQKSAEDADARAKLQTVLNQLTVANSAPKAKKRKRL
jgi:arylsulfatase A